ncbi:VIT domain-containing protein [Thermodesulfobacteriota bacterium]
MNDHEKAKEHQAERGLNPNCRSGEYGTALAKPKAPGYIFLVLGVIYPALVVGIEVSTKMCAAEFFDPVPSIWHILLVALVPGGNLLVWLGLRGRIAVSTKTLRIANGIAMGVSLYYTLLFLPMLPLAILAVVWLIGLLPMAPIVSFSVAVRGHFYLRKVSGTTRVWRVPATVAGLMIFLVTLTALDAQDTLTRVGMKMTMATESPSTRSFGIRMLRTVGNDELLLQSCYRRAARPMDLVGLVMTAGAPITPKKAREVYYRVTGVPFNSFPPPEVLTRNGRFLGFTQFDADVGDQAVAGRVKGLSLQGSRLDGSVDSAAALAYLQWTLNFKNDSLRQQEARANIALPAGAAVSRLTLWINGEEQEAVFARRGKVTTAYKRVVSRRRDPVLVTTNGPDRILVQCFPIPPQGGTMKVRIGITTPLRLPNKREGLLCLPRFVERNFQIPLETRHLVWIESKSSLNSRTAALTQERVSEDLYGLRGSLKDGQLADVQSLILCPRYPEIKQAWSWDIPKDDERVILQTIQEKQVPRPKRVVMVVDGSSGMKDHAHSVAKALKMFPKGIALDVVIATDDMVEIEGSQSGSHAKLTAKAAAAIRDFDYAGGTDNLPALARAWDLTGGRDDTAIVWIHASQPVLLQPVDLLLQRYERRSGGPRLFSVEAASGPNKILETLDGVHSLVRHPRVGALNEDLESLFLQWGRPGKEVKMARSRVAFSEVESIADVKQTSDHLARLWANDQVRDLRRTKAQGEIDRAVDIAVRYNLVTPITGAVVLETAQDYKRAGLTPPEPSDVPTIPEPETWALIIVAFLALAWAMMRRRRAQWLGV